MEVDLDDENRKSDTDNMQDSEMAYDKMNTKMQNVKRSMHATEVSFELEEQDYKEIQDFAEKIKNQEEIIGLIKEGRHKKSKMFHMPNAILNKFIFLNSRFFLTFAQDKCIKPK